MIKINEIKTKEDVGRFLKELVEQKKEHQAHARQRMAEMEAAGLI